MIGLIKSMCTLLLALQLTIVGVGYGQCVYRTLASKPESGCHVFVRSLQPGTEYFISFVILGYSNEDVSGNS